jgi:hypothetical protein
MNSEQLWWQPFREGKVKQNCSTIELSKNGSNEVAYQGPGELWQDRDGALFFKCYCSEHASSSIATMLCELAALQPGKLIPTSNYYFVRIVTSDGQEWTADNISPSRDHSLITGQVVVTGRLGSLRHVKSLESPSAHHRIRLLFIGQSPDDWSGLNGSEIACDEIGCLIRVFPERGSDVVVEIKSEHKLATNFEVRAIEALRYVLAKVIHVSVIEVSADRFVETTLISPCRAFESRLLPPLIARSLDNRISVRRLFERYLTFVHSQISTEFVHPCSAHLRNACEASSNAIETEVIGLCVAVEGIANLVPYERSDRDDEAIVTIRRTIAKWLEKRKFNDRLRARVTGLLSQLKDVNINHRLESLTQTGQLDVNCLNVWKTLRNQVVHPKTSKLEEFDERWFQELLDDLHQVYVCMYQITFALIGYEGAFSNYASKGFPVDAYPLRQQSSKPGCSQTN